MQKPDIEIAALKSSFYCMKIVIQIKPSLLVLKYLIWQISTILPRSFIGQYINGEILFDRNLDAEALRFYNESLELFEANLPESKRQDKNVNFPPGY